MRTQAIGLVKLKRSADRSGTQSTGDQMRIFAPRTSHDRNMKTWHELVGDISYTNLHQSSSTYSSAPKVLLKSTSPHLLTVRDDLE